MIHYYLIPIIFLLVFILILIKKPKENITINIDLNKSFGQQSEKYRQGYIRAKEIIRNGSDADELLNKSLSFDMQDDWDKGWQDACKHHLK